MNTINLTFVRMFIVLKKANGLIVLHLVDYIKKQIQSNTIDCHYINALNLCSDTTSLLFVFCLQFFNKIQSDDLNFKLFS